MALRPDRNVIETDIYHTCPTVAERGVVLCESTAGSGIGVGDSAGVADLYASASGKVPIGILMNDMVNIDLTRYHLNFHKEEMQITGRCTILRKGRVTTNKVTGTPTVGAKAYLTANGVLTPTLSTTGGLLATPAVGEFRTIIDESGFATVDVNLP